MGGGGDYIWRPLWSSLKFSWAVYINLETKLDALKREFKIFQNFCRHLISFQAMIERLTRILILVAPYTQSELYNNPGFSPTPSILLKVFSIKVLFHISFYRCGLYCTVHWAAQPVQFVDCVVEFMPPHFAGFSARFLCLGKNNIIQTGLYFVH